MGSSARMVCGRNFQSENFCPSALLAQLLILPGLCGVPVPGTPWECVHPPGTHWSRKSSLGAALKPLSAQAAVKYFVLFSLSVSLQGQQSHSLYVGFSSMPHSPKRVCNAPPMFLPTTSPCSLWYSADEQRSCCNPKTG